MVNKGGRSKGCSTCRRRRVKCDENRPVCNRCQRWNLECDGPKGTTFIHEDAAQSKMTKLRTVPPKTPDVGGTDPSNTPLLLSTPLRFVGFEVYICYTQESLRRDGLIYSVIQDTKRADIVPAESSANSLQVSNQAILSFATILFGTQHHQTDITRQGYVMHGVALQRLNKALSDQKRYACDEVIIAVAALAISECLLPSNQDNYLKHMVGLERLIEARDPDSFWSGKSHGFRHGVRFMILFASLRLGKPSILARPEWKKSMRANLSYEQLQEQDLFDVLADCTALLGRRKSMLANIHLDFVLATQQRDDIEREARMLLTGLREWKQQWDFDTMTNHPGVSTMPGPVQMNQEGHSTPRIILKNSALVMLMLYNLTLMHVLQFLAALPSGNLTAQNTVETAENVDCLCKPTMEDYLAGERVAALDSCRCLQDYLVGNWGVDPRTSTTIHWALGVAWLKLRRDPSEEGRWMRDLLSRKCRHIVTDGGVWTAYQWLDSPPPE